MVGTLVDRAGDSSVKRGMDMMNMGHASKLYPVSEKFPKIPRLLVSGVIWGFHFGEVIQLRMVK